MTALAHERDDHLASRKAPAEIPDVGTINATEAAHVRFGECVVRLEGLGYQLDRAFARLEEATEQMLASGVRAEPIMAPHVEAAFNAWRTSKPGEPPLPTPIVG